MKQVAPLSLGAFFFLSLAAFFGFAGIFPVGASVMAWIGGIQVFNSLAPKKPFFRIIYWLHAMTFELPIILGIAFLRFIPVKEKVKGSGKPILLVHGYMNHSSVWIIFKKRLEAQGFGPIYTINLGHPFRSIARYAEKVKQKVERITKETKRKDLILIGHSMGGLVSSFYAGKLAPKNTVTDVITLGSPLHGTPVAWIGIGPNAKEMRPNSELLKEMRDAMKKSSQIKFYHVATQSDQLVIPGRSAVLSENQHFLFEDLGHASLLYSKRVAKQVASWLS